MRKAAVFQRVHEKNVHGRGSRHSETGEKCIGPALDFGFDGAMAITRWQRVILRRAEQVASLFKLKCPRNRLAAHSGF